MTLSHCNKIMKTMKKLTLLAVLFLSVVLFSCNNGENNEKTENSDSTVVENVEDTENVSDNSEIITIKAKFDVVTFGTDGAWMEFVDENEKYYSFFDDGNESVHNTLPDIEPNVTSNDNTWYEIKYQTKTIQFYDGGTGKDVDRNIDVIVSIKKIDNNSSSSTNNITLNDIIATTFGGTEPFWSIKFNQTGAKYSAYVGAPEITLVYEIKESNGNTFSITANDHENMESFFITIKKETCSDGMSEKSYPYSIEIKKDNGTLYGCGWQK